MQQKTTSRAVVSQQNHSQNSNLWHKIVGATFNGLTSYYDMYIVLIVLCSEGTYFTAKQQNTCYMQSRTWVSYDIVTTCSGCRPMYICKHNYIYILQDLVQKVTTATALPCHDTQPSTWRMCQRADLQMQNHIPIPAVYAEPCVSLEHQSSNNPC